MATVAPDVLRLKVLDVGEGDSIVVLLPDSDRALVVDVFNGERVRETLEAEGVNEVVLFLSHSDADHIRGVRYLLQNFQGTVIASFYNKDRISAGTQSEYRKTIQALGKATRRATNPLSAEFNTNLNDLGQFQSLVTGRVSVEVLHPTHDEQSSFLGTTTNEPAGVLRIVYTDSTGRSWKLLLAADVQLTGISCIMHRFQNDLDRLQADVLKFPHHGSWPASHPGIQQFPDRTKRWMPEFLEQVNPEYIVLSVGLDNPHGHVRGEVFQTLQELATKKNRLRRIVCTQFTATCLATGASCDQPVCGGDVEVRIGESIPGNIEVVPLPPTHSARILAVTTQAQAGCGPLLSLGGPSAPTTSPGTQTPPNPASFPVGRQAISNSKTKQGQQFEGRLFGPAAKPCGDTTTQLRWLAAVIQCSAESCSPCRRLARLLKAPGFGALRRFVEQVRQFAGDAHKQGGITGFALVDATGIPTEPNGTPDHLRLYVRPAEAKRFRRILGGGFLVVRTCPAGPDLRVKVVST